MEIFGIPVVFTVQNIIGFIGVGVCFVLMTLLLAIMIILETAKKYIEWRNRRF